MYYNKYKTNCNGVKMLEIEKEKPVLRIEIDLQVLVDKIRERLDRISPREPDGGPLAWDKDRLKNEIAKIKQIIGQYNDFL
jgi:hypothetical protein